MPPPLDCVQRVTCLKLLGVIFEDSFKFNMHVDSLLKQCSQRVYLRKLLRSQGMSSEHLHQVTTALIISRLRVRGFYAANFGFLFAFAFSS